jgi:hypothetical protein
MHNRTTHDPLDWLRSIGVQLPVQTFEATHCFCVAVEPVETMVVPFLQRLDGVDEPVDLRSEPGVLGTADGFPVLQGVVELGGEVAYLVAGRAPLRSRQLGVVGSAARSVEPIGEPVDGGASTAFWRLPISGPAGLEVVAAHLESGELPTGIA